MNKVFIIAEAGVNHNGSLDLALKLCGEAKRIGVDAVKFQTFKTEKIVVRSSEMAEYQKQNTSNFDNQFDMIKALELSYDQFKIIKEYCEKINIEFMSTPDEEDSLDFLISLGVKKLKVGSGEVDNIPFLRRIAKHNLPTIFSTGMSTMEDIELLLNTVINAGLDKKNITLLHCNTEYPTPYHDVNLRAMLTMKEKYGVAIGYSDHTLGIVVPIAATALGAVCIEKHFTLDNNMSGPDHLASLNPKDFEEMVKAVRDTEVAMGSSSKQVTKSEQKNKSIIRKVIVAAHPIMKGSRLNESDLILKRSTAGISGVLWDKVVGKIADQNYCADQIISENLIKGE